MESHSTAAVCHSVVSGRGRYLLGAMLLLALAGLGAVPASAEAGTYSWARQGLKFSASQGLLPSSQLRRPGNRVTRKTYANALVRLEQYRAARYGSPTSYDKVAVGAKLSDQAPSSRYAKIVKLGWMTSQAGAFNARGSITATDASRGAVYALGLGGNSYRFARALKRETPGLRTRFHNVANEVMARKLGLRYNHLQGTERLERGPGEALTVAHVAYMMHKAATADPWRLSSAASYENFDLPALGSNQKRVLYKAIHLVGQPYVWGGETTGRQSEGHAGFDCSGFIVFVYRTAGVPQSQQKALDERTSMAMSAIPTSARVRRASRLRPGDLMFWGDRGPKSRPSENFHAGLYMGNGWIIHSTGSNDGVSIDRHEGWWAERFSWGRRLLRTA